MSVECWPPPPSAGSVEFVKIERVDVDGSIGLLELVKEEEGRELHRRLCEIYATSFEVVPNQTQKERGK